MKKLNDRGFSLVELLIAVVILGIVVAPLLHTFVTAAVTSVKSREAGAATTAAQNAVETIQANRVSTVLNGDEEELKSLFGADSALWNEGGDELALTNVTSGDQSFDLTLQLDPEPYETVNEQEITQFTAMDAIYTQNSNDPDEQVESAFSTVNPGADILSRSRQITVTVNSGAVSDGKQTMSVSVKYEYSFRYEATRVVDEVETSYTSTYTQSYNNALTDNSVGEDEDYSVYVFFNPYYRGDGAKKDTITVKNPSGRRCKVFLVKQKMEGVTSTDEAGYTAWVKLEESHKSGNYATTVFSNIGVNLVNEHGSVGSCKYTKYDGSGYRDESSFTGELVDRKAEDRLYRVTVNVYHAGAADPVLTFAASKLQ